MPCFILYSKDKLAHFSKCLLTSYFCIPIPYGQRVYRSTPVILFKKYIYVDLERMQRYEKLICQDDQGYREIISFIYCCVQYIWEIKCVYLFCHLLQFLSILAHHEYQSQGKGKVLTNQHQSHLKRKQKNNKIPLPNDFLIFLTIQLLRLVDFPLVSFFFFPISFLRGLRFLQTFIPC